MTWSTRTAVQCTGAPCTPIAAAHAPIGRGRAGSLGRIVLVGTCRARAPSVAPPDAARRSVRSSSRSPFAVPTALLGLASPAAADLGAPDRASVPAEINASAGARPAGRRHRRPHRHDRERRPRCHCGGVGGRRVSAPGWPARRAAVRFHQSGAGTWEVETGRRLRRSLEPAWLTNQTDPDGLARRRRLLTLCVAGYSPTVHGTLTAHVQLARSGEVGQHAAARAVRGRHRAGRVAVELGRPRRRRAAGHGLGLPGARGAGGGRPLLRPGRPRAATAATPTPAT